MIAGDLGLLTDLYELTMAQTYFQNRMFAPATFSLLFASTPPTAPTSSPPASRTCSRTWRDGASPGNL